MYIYLHFRYFYKSVAYIQQATKESQDMCTFEEMHYDFYHPVIVLDRVNITLLQRTNHQTTVFCSMKEGYL